MALETKDINNSADMRRYVEGCLNDLMEGLSTKDETMKYLHDYTLRVIDITAERVGQNASTSDEALPIADVGGSLPPSDAIRFGNWLNRNAENWGDEWALDDGRNYTTAELYQKFQGL